MKDIKIDELHKMSSKIDSTQEDPYLKTYPIFIQYFKDQIELTENNIIIGISLVYSWMPRILKNLNLDNITKATEIFNKAKSGNPVNKEELKLLIKTFDNSLVGVSKLLHFINPNMHAIWDSKVYSVLYPNDSNYSTAKNTYKYLKYLEWIDGIKQEPAFNQFYQKIKPLLGNDITEFRAVEYALFKKAN